MPQLDDSGSWRIPLEVETTMRDGLDEALPQLAELLGVAKDGRAELRDELIGLGGLYLFCRALHEDAPSRKTHRRRLERLRDHIDGAITEVVGMVDGDTAAFDALRPALGAVDGMAELQRQVEALLESLGPPQGDHKRAADWPSDWLVTAVDLLWTVWKSRPATRTVEFQELVGLIHSAVTSEESSFDKPIRRHFSRVKAPA